MMNSGRIKTPLALISKASDRRFVGRAQVLLSAMCFGAVGTFAKGAYASGMDAPMLLSLRFLVAAIALWSYFLVFNREAIRVSLRELATCAALGLAGYGIFSSLLFKALETAPASVVGLLWFSYPVFVILLEWVAGRKRPDAQLWLGSLVILCGVSIGALGSLKGGLSTGMMLAVGGAAWYAAYLIASERLVSNLKPQTVALYVTTFAAMGFFVMGGPVAAQMQVMNGSAWLAVLAIGLISTVIALLSFFSGLEKLGSSEASQLGTFDLIVSLALATVALGEAVSLPLMLGATIILAGLVMGQFKPSTRPAECPDDLPC